MILQKSHDSDHSTDSFLFQDSLIINVITVDFDQFNVSLQNKCIKNYRPQTFEW